MDKLSIALTYDNSPQAQGPARGEEDFEEQEPTEEEWGHKCTFPDCGCPEARLCIANDPNDGALSLLREPTLSQGDIGREDFE